MPAASEGETCDGDWPGVAGREDDPVELATEGGYQDCEETSWGRGWACCSCEPLQRKHDWESRVLGKTMCKPCNNAMAFGSTITVKISASILFLDKTHKIWGIII